MLQHNLSEYEYLFSSISDGQSRWKIGIYVRLSKDDGNKVSLSIVNQIKMIARHLKQFENFKIFDIYIDDGKTGTDFDRQDYIRLQQDVSNGFVNCIIVKDLTRYSRNIADGIKELDSYVLEKKIRFISLGIPQIDTYKNPTVISSNEVYQALQAAEEHARSTSKKVRDIKAIKREDGEKNGGFPPYGYLPNPDGEHWLPDPVAGEILKKMYLWSAEGMSDREIAKALNAEGIPNPTLYKQQVLKLKYYNPHAEKNKGLWSPITVGGLLASQVNLGCSVQGKSSSFDHKRHKQIPKKKEEYVIVPNCHEQLITKEFFETVSKLRSERTRVTKKTGKVHLFANLVYCSHCKKAMKKTSAKGHSYLVCRTYKDFGKEYCSTKRTINMKKLEDIVLALVQNQINLVIDLQATIEKINQRPIIKNQSSRIEQMIDNIKGELIKSEHLLDISYYDWKNGDISKEQYQRIKEDMENKIKQLNNTYQSLIVEQRKIVEGIKVTDEYFERFLAYRDVKKLDRLMLINLVKVIYINEDKSVEIKFNYEDEYLLILDYIEQNRIEEKTNELENSNLKEKVKRKK